LEYEDGGGMMKAKVKARGYIVKVINPNKYWFVLEIEHKDLSLGYERIAGNLYKRKSSAIKAAERVAEDMNLDIVWEK
jgi:hypothetical protein